jgi:hypothetical protein
MSRFVGFARAFALLALPLAVYACPAQAQTPLFQNIASSAANFSPFSNRQVGPSVNNNGVVAFRATRTDGARGIFTATSSASFTAVATSDTSGISNFFDPIINNNGVIAFYGSGGSGGAGIYTVNATGAITTVADSSFDNPNPVYNPGRISINDSGTVTFAADFITDESGVLRGTNLENVQILVDSLDPEFSFLYNSTINNDGVVVFNSTRDAGGSGIYVTNGNGFTTLGTTATTGRNFGDPIVAGNSVLVNTFDATGNEILSATTLTGGALTTIATTTSPLFSRFVDYTVNNQGTVAFIADRDAGGQGIFVTSLTGLSPVSVIGVGDSLFGSTVTALDFTRGLASDNTTVAFQYVLANGVSGIATASIVAAPEPGSVALLGAGLALFGGVVARRRK